jgi:energy-coupling factor transport system substrate-specific component
MGKKLIAVKTVVKTAAAIVIGAALMFLLNRYVALPSGVLNTNLNLGIAILAAFAAIFGPLAGFLIGLIGHFLTDLTAGYGLWWSWIFSSALFGLAVGFFWKSYNVEEGGFGIKQCLVFNGVQAVANVIAWVFIARTLDLIIYNEPFELVSLQGFVAAGLNIAVVQLLGSLIVFCYSKVKSRGGGNTEF